MNLKFKAKKIFTFDAAHFLADYQGKCANMHGHTYKLEITVSRINGGLVRGGSSDGMVVDFSQLNKIVKEAVIDKVDHKVINEVINFRATSENLASYFYDTLKVICTDYELKLEKIVLWESQTACSEVSEDDL